MNNIFITQSVLLVKDMSESVENLTSHQTTFTFCRQQSKDNPENLFESVVEGRPQEGSIAKPNSINKPLTLESLYQEKHKSSMEGSQVGSMQDRESKGFMSQRGGQQEHIQGSDEEEDHYQMQDFHSYMDLTSKLQSALNKISSSKRSSNSTSRSNNIILRFEELEQKKKEEMKKLKTEREREAVREVKNKPTINKNSVKIIKQMGHEPIHLRYEKIVQAKNKQLQINKELKQKQEMQKQAQFFEELQKYSKKPENVRSYEQYFSEMVRWKQRKVEENRQKCQKKRNQEIQGLSFHPTISNKSKKLMEGQTRLPISQRGLVRQKVKPMYTFTPNISSRHPK